MMRRGLTFDDVLLVPKYNDIPSRKDVDISTQMGPYKLAIPIMSAAMDTITGHKMACAMFELGGLGILHRFMSIENNVSEFIRASKESHMLRSIRNVSVSVGVHDTIERFGALYEAGARIVNLDVAHGHSKLAGNAVKELREFDGVYVIAGSVATYEGAQYLFDCGAHAIRCGIGAGSVCTTRMKAGVGVPSLSAIEDCRKSEAFLIADGGLRGSNDIVKAFAAGADCVMLGGALAGCDECPGVNIEEYAEPLQDNPHITAGNVLKKYKVFRGMASSEVSDDYFGSMSDWKTAEGVSIKVPFRGHVEHIIKDLLGGLRSAMTYNGALTIRQLKHKSEFIEITRNGYVEGTPHHGS